MLRMKEEDFMAVININLKGVFLCTSEASKVCETSPLRNAYPSIICRTPNPR